MESEREEAIEAADAAAVMLQAGQGLLDSARAKVNSNPSLAIVLAIDTERAVSDAMTRAERVRRYLTVARGKPINGRWPMVASKQREDAEAALAQALSLLEEAEAALRPLRAKITLNPALCEAIIADIALTLARALNRLERVVHLLTEAGIGRD